MGLYITDQEAGLKSDIQVRKYRCITTHSGMAAKNYTKSVLIRAREEEARSWALRASEGGKRLSTWIRETLNEGARYKPNGLSSESNPPEPDGSPVPDFEPVVEQAVTESKQTVVAPTEALTDDDMEAFLSEAFKP